MRDILSITKHYPPHKLLFFLSLFFLPQQFGPHFWPDFSFVGGVRVDYLSPALYISDILLVLLFVISFEKVFTNSRIQTFLFSKLFIIFLISLCIPLLYSLSPGALLFSLLKFFEFLYLGLYIAAEIKKQDIFPMSFIFLVTGLLESILAGVQFLNQGSINGIFYLLGERAITPSSLGAAVMNTPSGLTLRPYGTFSHPNVLAFFLFTSFIFGLFTFSFSKNMQNKIIILCVLFTIQIALLLTFSRVLILLDIFILSWLIFKIYNVKNFRKASLILGAAILGLMLLFLLSFGDRILNFHELLQAILPRQELIFVSLEMIQKHIFFGVGLNNFYHHEVLLQKSFSEVYLQPVHNIYLLIFAQTGIIGLSLILYFLFKTGVRLLRKMKSHNDTNLFPFILISLFSSVLFIGLFDHYLLTIQQGQLLCALILGLCFSKVSF